MWVTTFNNMKVTNINILCKKDNQKLMPHLEWRNRWVFKNDVFKILYNVLFRQKLIVWLCHNGTDNQKINAIHELCLWITYYDKILSSEKLLEKDGTAPVHERNLQVLATGTFRNNNVLSSTFMNNLKWVTKFLKILDKILIVEKHQWTQFFKALRVFLFWATDLESHIK